MRGRHAGKERIRNKFDQAVRTNSITEKILERINA